MVPVLTSQYLFCRCVQSLALKGRQGLDHITENKWTKELQQRKTKQSVRKKVVL